MQLKLEEEQLDHSATPHEESMLSPSSQCCLLVRKIPWAAPGACSGAGPCCPPIPLLCTGCQFMHSTNKKKPQFSPPPQPGKGVKRHWKRYVWNPAANRQSQPKMKIQKNPKKQPNQKSVCISSVTAGVQKRQFALRVSVSAFFVCLVYLSFELLCTPGHSRMPILDTQIIKYH